MGDFGEDTLIEVRSYTDNWGPYSFELSEALPPEDPITAVTVKAYVGRIKPRDILADQTEITDLVDPAYLPQVFQDTSILIKLQYPGDSYKGKATLVFQITTQSGGKNSYYYDSVIIS